MAMRAAADSRVQGFEKEAVIHLDALFGAASKMTRSHTEAEDLVQEAYLRAFRFHDRLQKRINCKSRLLRARRKLQKGTPGLRDGQWLCAGGTCE